MRLLYVALFAVTLFAQGTRDDYKRAEELRARFQALTVDFAESPHWLESNAFWYRKSVQGGHEFVLVDAASGAKSAPFDSAKLAAALSAASGKRCTAQSLPFNEFTFTDGRNGMEFQDAESKWKADLRSYALTKTSPAARRPVRGNGVTRPLTGPVAPDTADRAVASPDGKWEAYTRNYNLVIRAKGGKPAPLSFDGSESNYYSVSTIAWSPDSKKIAVYRVKPVAHRRIQYVESSPLDQVQPKYSTFEYAKPGDELDRQQPVLFDAGSKKQIAIDDALFRNPYQLLAMRWRADSRAFTFEYNQRGHQVYRIIEVDAASGKPRAVISEEAATFFCYSSKRYRHDVDDGREVIWMSERDGWNHLYMFDGATGRVKHQITKGPWVVRGVDQVDDKAGQIWFRAGGMREGTDPYFIHHYRINFDGSGLTALTQADANHTVTFSPDRKHYVDTWSRVDHPPVAELRRASDGAKVAELERGSAASLLQAGYRMPEPLTSTARDGKSSIWGVIMRPTNFDPSRKYPVIEYIYAGPHDSFVPKFFAPHFSMQSLAEIGFIVVQIDGMGTSNRSKAFHDVAWKNLGDAGFPDRILWHKAVAAKYPWYDISRVGIYGHSAGGQNSLGALLFHPEFYKVAVSSCGCHDNRMDKIWWNEQWMGWPLGPEYVACSNVENAHRLKGKLLLSVGEMDTNVDPASTMQVVNALVKANKVFDLLVLPGQGHSNGGAYGERKRNDFFVHHLLGAEPPQWNE